CEGRGLGEAVTWSRVYAYGRRRGLACRELSSVHDLDSLRPGRSGYRRRCRLDVLGVQVGELDLGDLSDLRFGDGADFVSIRRSGSLFNSCFLLQQNCRRRRLGDEREGLVRVDGDLDRENRILALRPSVELFAEGHDVDSLRAESRP